MMKYKICTICKQKLLALKKYFYGDNRHSDKLQSECKHCQKKYKIKYRHDNPNICKNYDRLRNLKYKQMVIAYYGGKCAVCGETHIAFLTIDHINNDGYKHRNILQCGNFYKWIIKNNFPKEFQVLCWNHQHLKHLEYCKSKWNMDNKYIYNRKYCNNIKMQIFNNYGTKCACCGNDNIDVLTIDHIYGGGRKHIKLVGHGTAFYRWLKNNNFPPGFQILCFNCNCGKSINKGICPHKEK